MNKLTCLHGNGPECAKCGALDIPEVEEMERELSALRARLATVEGERDNALRYTELLIAERDALNKLADECSNEAQCAQQALLTAQAGEARAGEALRTLTAKIALDSRLFMYALVEAADAAIQGDSLAWLAQQRAEAAAEALEKEGQHFGQYQDRNAFADLAFQHVARHLSQRAAALRAGASGGSDVSL